ncbi:hypothetical protein [Halarcobacter anaerophilus]|uniref:Uncharacterized protein n=1 Tax=Halarcobacter anaerophilus TaxID=877500 RepID=A0A4Q0Y322_9BACT|nr:hypothetical protein [Halarcobacter anaerophilus]QDF27801.1 putative membrane protein [Halarcobacter anaerophilus]RXJ64143.1 hypothetical protein CRV06_04160 [Halarcobacter anaerophilus]
MKKLKKEIIVFFTIFVLSSLIMHYSAWISHPIEHIKALSYHSMPYHPILYTFIIYILVAVVRGIFLLIKKIISKK